MAGIGNIIKVNKLSITFEGTTPFKAIDNISFSIDVGKTLALVGQSGSGKSITSLAIMGLLPESAKREGSIILQGFPQLNAQSGKTYQNIRGKEIGMIFQEPMSALNPIISCGNQLMESILAHQKISTKRAKQLVIEWFEKVKLPDPSQLFHRYPHQLSGGQKQRVMIAMAMCNHPKLLIADEPTTALDVTVQMEIILLMKQLQKEMNTALLFITHDLALAKIIADDFLILENGKVVQTPLNFTLPEPKINTETSNHKKVPLLKVDSLDIFYSEKKSFLGKTTRYFKAVNNVSFEIFPSETLGLVGESGCGKSTLSKAILRLQGITSGKIYFEETDISTSNSTGWRKLRRKIQIIFQDPYASLNPRIKVGNAIQEPMLAHNLMDEKQSVKEVENLLDLVQLPKSAKDKYPHEFSGGQRQRICIARALAVDPKLIICDESVSALDVKIQGQILKLLADLQQEKKLTYLFITHDLNVVRSISDRILIMEKGEIIESGPTQDVMDFPKEDYTKRLLAAVPGR